MGWNTQVGVRVRGGGHGATMTGVLSPGPVSKPLSTACLLTLTPALYRHDPNTTTQAELSDSGDFLAFAGDDVGSIYKWDAGNNQYS